MNQFHIDKERCTQCGECAADCPAGIITMDGWPVITNEANCYRCQHCLAVCPTGAVSVLGRDPAASTQLAGNLPTSSQMATLIKGRRSVRRYSDEDLPAALIDELLEVACHAPTGVNNQGVLFTVVRSRAVLHTLRDEVLEQVGRLADSGELPEGFIRQYLGYAVKAWREEGKDVIFRGAPHLLITSAPKTAPCPAQDTLIALTTFQLMAHTHGLGTVWDGLFTMALSLCPQLPARLGIPENHLIGYAMVFGRPAVEYQRTVQRGPARVNAVREAFFTKEG